MGAIKIDPTGAFSRGRTPGRFVLSFRADTATFFAAAGAEIAA